ncbi:MAG: DUF4157 domain-containing protein [Myxococcota bacterium]
MRVILAAHSSLDRTPSSPARLRRAPAPADPLARPAATRAAERWLARGHGLDRVLRDAQRLGATPDAQALVPRLDARARHRSALPSFEALDLGRAHVAPTPAGPGSPSRALDLATTTYAVQLDANDRVSAARGPAVGQVLARLGRGRALPVEVVERLGPELAALGHGVDLAQVRVHDDAEAAALCRELRANAFAVGRHVVFGAGRFQPDSADGLALLAHELTHVWQQSRGLGQGGGVLDDPSLERTARDAADAVRQRASRPMATTLDPLLRHAHASAAEAQVRPGAVFVVTDRIHAYDARMKARGSFALTGPVPTTPGVWFDGGVGLGAWSSLSDERVGEIAGGRADDLWVFGGQHAPSLSRPVDLAPSAMSVAADTGGDAAEALEKADDLALWRAIDARVAVIEDEILASQRETNLERLRSMRQRLPPLRREKFLLQRYGHAVEGIPAERLAELRRTAASEADTLEFLANQGERGRTDGHLSPDTEQLLIEQPTSLPETQIALMRSALADVAARRAAAHRRFQSEVARLTAHPVDDVLESYLYVRDQRAEIASQIEAAELDPAHLDALEARVPLNARGDDPNEIEARLDLSVAPLRDDGSLGVYFPALREWHEFNLYRGIDRSLTRSLKQAQEMGFIMAAENPEPNAVVEIERAVDTGPRVEGPDANSMPESDGRGIDELLLGLERRLDLWVAGLDRLKRDAVAVRLSRLGPDVVEALEAMIQPPALVQLGLTLTALFAIQAVPYLNVIVDSFFAAKDGVELIDVGVAIMEFVMAAEAATTIKGLTKASEKLEDLGDGIVSVALMFTTHALTHLTEKLLEAKQHKVEKPAPAAPSGEPPSVREAVVELEGLDLEARAAESAARAAKRRAAKRPPTRAQLKNPKRHPEYGRWMEQALGIGIPVGQADRLWSLIIDGLREGDRAKLGSVADSLVRWMDVQPGKAALWSGGIDLSDYAAAQGRQTLESQVFYRATKGLKLCQDKRVVFELWKMLSVRFAQQIKGEVHVYLRDWDPASVLVTTELMTLHGIPGVTVKYHAMDWVDGPGHYGEHPLTGVFRELDGEGNPLPEGAVMELDQAQARRAASIAKARYRRAQARKGGAQ